MSTKTSSLVRFRSYLVRFLDDAGVCRTGEGILNSASTTSTITNAKCFNDGKEYQIKKLLPPVDNPPSVVCIGLNYKVRTISRPPNPSKR